MNLLFTRRGALQLKLDGRSDAVDLIAPTQDSRAESLFLKAILRSSVSFEAGLTVRELLTCLKPWNGILLEISGTNVEAWLEAGDRRVEPLTTIKEIELFSAIEIRPVLKARPLKSGKTSGKPAGLRRLTTPDILPSNAYEISTSWCGAARLKRAERHGDLLLRYRSLTLSPIASWIDTPIRIMPKAQIRENSMPGQMSWTGPLFNRKNPLLTDVLDANGMHMASLAATIESASFKDVILEAFLDDLLFYAGPDAAQTNARIVRARIAKLQLDQKPKSKRGRR